MIWLLPWSLCNDSHKSPSQKIWRQVGKEIEVEENKKEKQATEETSKITQACVRQLCHIEKLQYLTSELSTRAAHNAQAQLADPLAEASILVQNTRFSLPSVSRAPVVGC